MTKDTLKKLSENGFELQPKELNRINNEMVVVDWFQPDIDLFVEKLPKVLSKNDRRYAFKISPILSISGGFWIGYIDMMDNNKALFKMICGDRLSDALGNLWVELKKQGIL